MPRNLSLLIGDLTKQGRFMSSVSDNWKTRYVVADPGTMSITYKVKPNTTV